LFPFDETAIQALKAHAWPGNVRELRNLVFRLALNRPERVTADDVALLLGPSRSLGLFSADLLRSRPIPDLIRELEREHLLQLHADSSGDLRLMAATMSISVRTLYDRLKRLGLKPGELGEQPPLA
jgi:DNA-binding NtrC family response regulator